jgi:hypothetical protein
MEKYIHRENLALFKKRLAESHSDAERQMLLKLLVESERTSTENGQSQA